MLLNYRVANYRSLKDTQEFDLRPVYRKNEHALRVAAIYGANASGKSNILRSLRFMHDVILEQEQSWKNSDGAPRDAFLLDESSQDVPSSFAVDVMAEGVRYSYGFSVDGSKVTEEWLYGYPKGSKRKLFEREGQEYSIGPSVAAPRVTLLQELVPDNGLFLSAAARAKLEEFRPVYDWFRSSIWFASDDRQNELMRRRNTQELLGSVETAERVQELIRAADLGIREARLPEVEFVFEEVPQDRGGPPPGGFQVRPGKGGAATIIYSGDRPNLTERQISRLMRGRDIMFEHVGQRSADLSFEEESRGTKAWFDMIGFVLQALRNGWTLVIDELDTSLHPLLIAHLVRLFQHSSSNPKGAQIIFTTHDVSLLGRQGGEELLHRDEIWFVEKSDVGESTLFSLTDFKPRDGMNWEKRYLGGALGAVPYVNASLLADAVTGGTGE
ncbi:ATP/GTP-binding protein [Streptomyces sp. NPDC058691]|uniref:AAA family ATPase n=1 Tax=Streptomyces sp. NPDC058691 TaxID=3346601 RepID=UPI00364DA047